MDDVFICKSAGADDARSGLAGKAAAADSAVADIASVVFTETSIV